MWMLVTTLCLQLSSTDARCEREVSGPHLSKWKCQARVRDHRPALIAIADDVGAHVLFLSVVCKKGRDS